MPALANGSADAQNLEMIFFALLIALLPADWTPPSRLMPLMPRREDLHRDWAAELAPWFAELDQDLSEIRLDGEGSGSARLRLARFSHGMRSVEVWSDRNGDGRTDMIEVYENGAAIVQLVDSDYDGSANILRRYDAAGALRREERY
jgi:hypothetical protein